MNWFRPPFLALVVAVTVLVGCGGDDRLRPETRGATTARPTPPRDHRDAAPVAAYVEDGAVFVVDAAGRSKRIAPARRDVPRSELTWSATGNYLAWIDHDGALFSYRVADAELTSWACPCAGLAFQGDTIVSIERDDRLLVRFDPTSHWLRSFTAEHAPWVSPVVMGAAQDGVVVAAAASRREVSAKGGPLRFHRVTQSGATVEWDEDVGNMPPTMPRPSPDGRVIAFAGTVHAGSCDIRQRIGLLDASTGELRFPPLPPARRGWRVLSLDWTPAYELTAVLLPSGCDAEGALRSVGAARVWRFADGRWLQTGIAAVGYDEGDGARARIKASGSRSEEWPHPGRLRIDAGRGEIEVSERASRVSVRPPVTSEYDARTAKARRRLRATFGDDALFFTADALEAEAGPISRVMLTLYGDGYSALVIYRGRDGTGLNGQVWVTGRRAVIPADEYFSACTEKGGRLSGPRRLGEWNASYCPSSMVFGYTFTSGGWTYGVGSKYYGSLDRAGLGRLVAALAPATEPTGG